VKGVVLQHQLEDLGIILWLGHTCATLTAKHRRCCRVTNLKHYEFISVPCSGL